MDPSYGEIVFYSYTWGINNEGNFFSERVRLESHVCTPEQLGMVDGDAGDKATFYSIHRSSIVFVKNYQKKFLCIDKKDLFIYGNIGS